MLEVQTNASFFPSGENDGAATSQQLRSGSTTWVCKLSNEIINMCDAPPRVDANASDLESGDQLICMKPSYQKLASVSFLSGPPSAGSTKMPLSSFAHLAKAICVPSGDQAELIQCDGCSVSLIIRSEPIVFSYRSNPCSGSRLQANATWLPSGEKVGATSCPGRLVNRVTLTDEKFD